MNVRRVVSKLISSNMYVVQDEFNAIIIDPSCSDDLVIDSLANIKIDYILLTHEHYDHIAGLNDFKDKSGAIVVASQACAEALKSPSKNLSKFFNFLAELMPHDRLLNFAEVDTEFVSEVDIAFVKELHIYWKGHEIVMIATPGHSPGSACIVIDKQLLFSGDSLINGFNAVTRLPGGSKRDYQFSMESLIQTLPPLTQVYPGHLNGFLLKDFAVQSALESQADLEVYGGVENN
ncbi:MAG: MBL fold metallo-hydrolase [Candidatus Cloacimonetes bacterium]|nr:MBL fold metallo-hydrolase [Candidatus Cloacimonadota bacterium]